MQCFFWNLLLALYLWVRVRADKANARVIFLSLYRVLINRISMINMLC